jgi:hypothetical protein
MIGSTGETTNLLRFLGEPGFVRTAVQLALPGVCGTATLRGGICPEGITHRNPRPLLAQALLKTPTSRLLPCAPEPTAGQLRSGHIGDPHAGLASR